MRKLLHWLVSTLIVVCLPALAAKTTEQIVDIPTRPGATQRLLVLKPPQPLASVVLLAGGHGGLRLLPDGTIQWGKSNFLVRTRRLFAEQGLLVAVVDAPSDRQTPPYLQGFRQTDEHTADLKAVIAWLRGQAAVPVWLVGTSRGTQSAAHAAIQLAGSGGPDGLVLTSTILSDRKGRPVTAMALDTLRIPVLVVHHEQDGCALCAYGDVPALMRLLSHTPRHELMPMQGGDNLGDPCEALAYHGFNGLDAELVPRIAAWMLTK